MSTRSVIWSWSAYLCQIGVYSASVNLFRTQLGENLGGKRRAMTQKDSSDPDELFSGIEDTVGSDHADSPTDLEKRPRGILSKTDREYLWGLRDYAHSQSEANRKQDIRERIVHSFQDYPILCLLLDDKDQKRIFKEEINEESLQSSLEAMIAFVYRGLDQNINRLESIIENGVYIGTNLNKGGQWTDEAIDVNVSIDIERNPDADELYQRFKEGETDQLTPAEIGVLVQSGKLNSDDLNTFHDADPDFPGVYVGTDTETGDPIFVRPGSSGSDTNDE